MYEILSNLPESVAYTCVNCTERHPAEWRLALEKELQISLKQVLTALLNSRTTSHLLRYRQAAKPPDLNPETEESIPSRSSPEGPDPPVLTEVSKQEDQQPLDLEGVKRKMDQGNYTSVVCLYLKRQFSALGSLRDRAGSKHQEMACVIFRNVLWI